MDSLPHELLPRICRTPEIAAILAATCKRLRETVPAGLFVEEGSILVGEFSSCLISDCIHVPNFINDLVRASVFIYDYGTILYPLRPSYLRYINAIWEFYAVADDSVPDEEIDCVVCEDAVEFMTFRGNDGFDPSIGRRFRRVLPGQW